MSLNQNERKQVKILLGLIKNNVPNYEDYIYQILNIGEYENYIIENINNKENLITYIEKKLLK